MPQPQSLHYAHNYICRSQLINLPSDYDPKAPDYDPAKWTVRAFCTGRGGSCGRLSQVTAIVTVYRRPKSFERMLWALANQTHKPTEVRAVTKWWLVRLLGGLYTCMNMSSVNSGVGDNLEQPSYRGVPSDD
jgi:hypothetical protein